MIRATLLALALAAGVAITATPVLAEIDWDEISVLEQEGTDFFNRAGNTDLSRDKRNDALVEAYTRLKKAYKALNAHCDEHPDQIEALDERMVRINMMLFWVKKEAPLDLFERMRRSGGGAGGGAPKADPPAEKEEGGMRAVPDEPNPKPKPKPAPTPEADTEEHEEPVEIEPPKPKPEAPKTPLAIARAHEKSKPHDIAGAVELWLDVLMAVEDTASPEYAEALARMADLSGRLKDLYRQLRNDDPDAIKAAEKPGRESEVAKRIAAGLSADAADDRKDAAQRLAALGWTPAALSIQSALRREKDAGVRDAMFLSLVRLGGSRTCSTLSRFSKERNDDLALGAVRSLSALAHKGQVQARYAGASLGTFAAKSKSKKAPAAALAALRELGKDGVPGLVTALSSKDREVRLTAIDALADAKDVRAASALAERMTDKVDDKMRNALVRAVTEIGRPAVPALIDALKSRKTRRNAGVALYSITGEPFGEDPKAWTQWWRSNGDD